MAEMSSFWNGLLTWICHFIDNPFYAIKILKEAIAYCGPSVVAYATSQAAADRAAEALYDEVSTREAAFATDIWQPAAAVAHAVAAARVGTGPVVLADTQDNPGGGANSDTVGLLEELAKLRRAPYAGPLAQVPFAPRRKMRQAREVVGPLHFAPAVPKELAPFAAEMHVPVCLADAGAQYPQQIVAQEVFQVGAKVSQ